ncbi:MAG: hypothetical protein ACHQ4H_05705 [Ktedonobacterales bacterium]
MGEHKDEGAGQSDRERRLDALSALAAGATIRPPGAEPADELTIAPPESLRPPRAPHRGSRRGALLAALLLAVVVAGGLGYALAHRPAGTQAAAVKVKPFDLSSAQMACPQQLAWSPDGTRIAVLGYARGCQGYILERASIAIFRARDGALLRHIALDQLVFAANLPAVAPVPAASANFEYGELIWSPDSKQVATTFALRNVADQSSTVLSDAGGIVLANTGTPGGRAFAYPAGNGTAQANASFNRGEFPTWDLQSGTAQFGSVPLALGYTWLSGGVLAPTATPAASMTPVPGPIGTPDGGGSFSVWQASYLQLNTRCPDESGTPPAPAFAPFYDLRFSWMAWSPDGRYIVQEMSVSGRLPLSAHVAMATPGAGFGCGANYTLIGGPTLPLRDAALAQTARSLNASTGDVHVAWSPNGRLFAASPPPEPGAASAIVVRDCASGAIVATFTPPADASQPSPDLSQFAWSPDSHAVAVLIMSEQTLSLWHVPAA